MVFASLPADESQSLQALLAYRILDTDAEKEFDNITKLLSQICQTSISLISFLDQRRIWFKSSFGLDIAATSREISFCSHAILGEEIMEVQDSLQDERFKDNPIVIGGPQMRFYAGMPLITPQGYKLGTLCVFDQKPRKLSENQQIALKTLAQVVITQLELRLHIQQMKFLERELEKQKKIVEDKNEKLLASIGYGEKIQKATMPSLEYMQKLLPQFFVLLKPRDIVSGDTFWCTKRGHKILLAAIDCTGHGVPGAMLSMLAQSLLNEIVNVWSITSPDLILYELHRKVRQILNQAGGNNHDGMDMALCVIDTKADVLEYAGAKNPMYLIQEGALLEVKADKYPIGGLQKEEERLFTKHSFSLSSLSHFYLFSDGYTDQFGGSEGNKFMAKRLKALLLSIYQLPMGEQREKLAQTMHEWMGNERQIDDILLLGVCMNECKALIFR